MTTQEKRNALKIKKMTEDFLQKAPTGTLKMQIRRGNVYYFQQQKNSVTGKFEKKYITKENVVLAAQLAQKAYFIKLLPLLDKAIKAGDIGVVEKEIENLYDNLHEGRRILVNPVWITVKEKLRRWYSESYEPYLSYQENLLHETDRGELVRSKSEKEIANELNRNKDILDYKYERPLKMNIRGREELFHPDFTVIYLKTGKIKYWEHAGRMDDPRYVNSFIEKINTYIENGIYPGGELIITYETTALPLNNRCIRSWIEKI